MCNHSLMHYPNRLARRWEDLLVHQFPSGSKGLVSRGDLLLWSTNHGQRKLSFWAAVKELLNPTQSCSVPAICIPTGSQLWLRDISKRLQREFHVSSEEEVTFEQISAAAHVCRDAVCFRNGRRVRLQHLAERQRLTVLSLPPDERDIPDIEHDGELIEEDAA